MRAVDIDVHRREAVLKTLGDEALGCEVIALSELVTANDVEYAWVALKASGVKMYSVEEMGNASKATLRIFERYPPHKAVDLIAQRQQVLGQVAAVLAGD